MFRLIFDTQWFQNVYDTWNNTMLMQDLHAAIKICLQWVLCYESYYNISLLNNLTDKMFWQPKLVELSSLPTSEWLTSLQTANISTQSFSFFITYLAVIEVFSYLLFFFLLSFKCYHHFNTITSSSKSTLMMRYEIFIFSFINILWIKLETFEETLCLIIFWPWCIVLVFTHVIFFDTLGYFFIFIEWGLPVFYGYLIICEYLWNFGSFFFIYLNGTRGRRSLIVTILEDVINFFILFARISLQMIRGLICGLYHDFFRELTGYIIDTWDSFFYLYNWQTPFVYSTPYNDLLLFIINVYLLAFVLLMLYFILFLQLLFLLIAVWLFARCWFISKKPVNTTNWKNLFNV